MVPWPYRAPFLKLRNERRSRLNGVADRVAFVLALSQGFSARSVLDLAHAEGEDDVPNAANDREGGHPGDQEHGAAAVVAGGPEAECELDDAPDQLQPPDLH